MRKMIKELKTKSIFGVLMEQLRIRNQYSLFYCGIFKQVENRYVNLDTKVEGTRSNFTDVSKLTIKCSNVNEAKGSSYTNLPDSSKCKNSNMNPKNIDDRYVQYVFTP